MKQLFYFGIAALFLLTLLCPTAIFAEDRIHILYDSESKYPELEPGWGFSAVVEKGDLNILVDTGWDVGKLKHNMAKMGWKPQDITHLIISHWHGDHYSGLSYLLEQNKTMKVYLPSDNTFQGDPSLQINTVKGLAKINEDVYVLQTKPTTGSAGIDDELTLAVLTNEGPVLVSGCFHSGWQTLIAKAQEISERKPYLMVGGGRFIDRTEPELHALAASIQKLGLKNVGLSHCAAGPLPEKVFEEYFPDRTLKARLGERISLPEN